MTVIVDIAVKVVNVISITVIVANTQVGVTPVFVDVKIFESDGTTLVAEKASGETFTIPKHDILLPDGTVHQSDEFNVDFNLPIIYNIPDINGQQTSFRTGDAKDIWTNTFSDGTLPSVGQRMLLDGTDFTKLLTKNSFGTLERFTNNLGGTTYDGTGGEEVDYVVDNWTSLAWTRKPQTTAAGGINNAIWNDHIDNALIWTQGTFSSFFLPSMSQLTSICMLESGTKVIDYQPFNFSTNTRFWVSNTAIISSGQSYVMTRDAQFLDISKGSTDNGIYCRKHF